MANIKIPKWQLKSYISTQASRGSVWLLGCLRIFRGWLRLQHNFNEYTQQDILYSKLVSNNKIYAPTSTKQGLLSSTFEASLVRTWPWFSSQSLSRLKLYLLCFSNYSSLFGDLMSRGLRKSRYNLLWKLQKSASLLLSHVPHVSNNHSHNILQFWTLFYRNLIKITQAGRRGKDESKMNLQLPGENSLTSVGLLGSWF